MNNLWKRFSCRVGQHDMKVVAISNNVQVEKKKDPNLPAVVEFVLLPWLIAGSIVAPYNYSRHILCSCSACSKQKVYRASLATATSTPKVWEKTKLTYQDISELKDGNDKPLFWNVHFPGWHLKKDPFTGRKYPLEEWYAPVNGEDIKYKQ